MAETSRFTSAQRVASAQRKLLAQAEGFDELLTELIRQPTLGQVTDELILRDTEGGGLLLRIQAEILTDAEVAVVEARHRRAR